MNDQAMETALYGGPKSEAPPVPDVEPTALPIEDRMFPEVKAEQPDPDAPADIAAMRKADASRAMYPSSTTYSHITDETLPAGTNAPMLREIMADLELPGVDATVFARMAREPAADADTRATWRADAEKAIAAEGITSSQLDAACKLVARDPRVQQYLRTSGHGDRIEVIKHFVFAASRRRRA